MGGLMGGSMAIFASPLQDINLNYLIAVGLIIGFIFGATNIIRFGAGPQGPLRTLGQYMLGSGATFGYVKR